MKSVFDFSVKNAKGEMVSLDQYRGKVLLIVNVASKCGFTPQYDGLEKLHQEFRDQGLVVLGFPCNQFGAQEPGSDSEIQQFCSLEYGVSFPVMGKVEVNGDGADPLYKRLKGEAPGVLGTEGIKWNFTKFLVSRDGQKVERYAPTTKPEDMKKDIQKVLG